MKDNLYEDILKVATNITLYNFLDGSPSYPNPWISGISVIVLYTVVSNSKLYRCKLVHTTSAASQPGVGASWTTYWDPLPPFTGYERMAVSSQFSNDETSIPLIYDSQSFSNYAWQYQMDITNNQSPYQNSSIVKRGDLGLFDSGLCWLTKNKMLSTVYSKSGSTVGGDSGLYFGTNSLIITSIQKFKSILNLWTYKPADPSFYGGYEPSVLTFNSNESLECYGGYGSPIYSITSSMYNDSNEVWTARTQDSGCGGQPGRIAAAGCSLTSDIGMAVGGYISPGATPISRQYQKSGDSWSARVNYPISICYTPSVSYTTDRFFMSTGNGIAGYGYPSASIEKSSSYLHTYSSNSWTLKSYYPIALLSVSAVSISAYISLFSGGRITSMNYDNTIYRMEAGNYWASTYSQLLPQVFEFQSFSHSQSLSTFFGGFTGNPATSYTPLDNTYQFISGYNWWDGLGQINFDCPLPINKRQDFVKTINITNTKTPIKNVLVVTSNACDKSVDDTTIGLSLDGGKTWKDDLNPGKVLNTDGLSPDTDGFYKLKVKVNTYNSTVKNTDVWTFKTDPSVVRGGLGSFSLGTDYGLYFGGSIGVTAYNLVDRYKVSTDSFTSKTTFINIAKTGISGSSLNSDLGIIFGGAGNPGAPVGYNHCERYSNTLNLWTSRTAFPVVGWSIQPVTYNWDLVGGISGWNGGVYYTNYLYTHSHNTWQSKTAITQGVTIAGYATLSHNEALITGGLITEVSPYYAGTQKFNLAANIWWNAASIIEARIGGFSASLGSSRALFAGGVVYPRSSGPANYRNWTEEYSYISNIWMLRQNIPNKVVCSSSFSATSDSSFGICTPDILTSTHHLKYFSGHVDNPSFLVQVLD